MSSHAASTTAILGELRSLLSKYQLDAYLVPSEDYHDSEYLADCDKRRHFLTRFTGSAGIAVVTKEKALLWTDGRYHIQATRQLDDNWTLMKAGQPDVPRCSEWLGSQLPTGSVVGVDPRQTSNAMFESLKKSIEGSGRRLRPVTEHNLVDLVWKDRPQRPNNPLLVLDVEYAGEGVASKISRLREKFRKESCYAMVVTALDEVAWLLNMRGSDIPMNPVFFSFVVVTMGEVHLCIDPGKLTDKVREHLGDLVKYHDYEDFRVVLETVVAEAEKYTVAENGDASGEVKNEFWRVWVPSQADQGTLETVPVLRRLVRLSPLASMKAVKNTTERKHMVAAHVEDAVALCEYLLWLEEEVGKQDINEWEAAQKVDGLRAERPSFISLSFETISSIGPNGAVIHYKPEQDTARALNRNELYLVDSGAQYLSGTTDVTRTIHLSEPSDEERANFTRVLKGHIALSRAIFPTNTHGSSIDCLARLALWREGLDYIHGTGHGVGAFLNVHEGPCGISGTRGGQFEEGIKEGMMITIEPGFYKEGAYGIRIENVCEVVRAETPNVFNNRQPLTFKPITYVPIQTKLIDPRMLDAEEVAWINDYHAECLRVVGDPLKFAGKEKVYKWLERETQPIG